MLQAHQCVKENDYTLIDSGFKKRIHVGWNGKILHVATEFLIFMYQRIKHCRKYSLASKGTALKPERLDSVQQPSFLTS